MNIILHDVLYCFHAYIDDIVIYSGSWEDHCVHLVVVLEKLRDTGLILKTSKYERGIASCVYLILGSLLAMVIDVRKNVRLIPSKATISSNYVSPCKDNCSRKTLAQLHS